MTETNAATGLRIWGVGGCPSQDFAWVQSVYDLSYLHHGSPLRRPRLPITTHFADRLAYVLASAGEDGAAWDRILALYVRGPRSPTLTITGDPGPGQTCVESN